VNARITDKYTSLHSPSFIKLCSLLPSQHACENRIVLSCTGSNGTDAGHFGINTQEVISSNDVMLGGLEPMGEMGDTLG
jgi:hypothetical protein